MPHTHTSHIFRFYNILPPIFSVRLTSFHSHIYPRLYMYVYVYVCVFVYEYIYSRVYWSILVGEGWWSKHLNILTLSLSSFVAANAYKYWKKKMPCVFCFFSLLVRFSSSYSFAPYSFDLCVLCIWIKKVTGLHV